jgi:hypothetical protein
MHDMPKLLPIQSNATFCGHQKAHFEALLRPVLTRPRHSPLVRQPTHTATFSPLTLHSASAPGP